jgi:tripartite-type tricarboxylate transporter receptor subunit TctC
MKRLCRYLGLMMLGLLLINSGAHAQSPEYPNRPVLIINPAAAGGGVDITARVSAEILYKAMGQPFTVENRTGGALNPGAEFVALSPPDGYTLLATPPQLLTIQDILFKKLSYDPSAFEPIAIIAISPNVLVVRGDFPAKTLPEVIAYIKANPGKVVYASQGIGSTTHLTAELLQRRTGTTMTHVPYRGSAPALNDLIGGHVDLMFVDLGSALASQQSGRARIVGVADKERSPDLPDVPTLSEAGLKDFQSITWFSLAAPPGTPSAITDKLNRAIIDGMASHPIKAKYNGLHYRASNATPKEIKEFMKSERVVWGDVISAANISLK